MTIVFQYNQEQAVTAGESSYINESGAYKGHITSAKWVKTQNGAKGLEFSFEDESGLKANYITIYHTKKDGSQNTFGQAHINAIMGLVGLQQLTAVSDGKEYICPELKDKPIGLVLQKALTTKQDGSESYKFELVVAFHAVSRQTMKEKVEQLAAMRVDSILKTLKDKDERNKESSNSTPRPPQRAAAQPPQPVDDIDYDIPF